MATRYSGLGMIFRALTFTSCDIFVAYVGIVEKKILSHRAKTILRLPAYWYSYDIHLQSLAYTVMLYFDSLDQKSEKKTATKIILQVVRMELL